MLNTILDFVAQAGIALAPVIASALMLIVGTLFYRLTGLLPGFVRAYIEKAYREKEAMFRASIQQAIVNGITAAVSRGKTGRDALSDALAHVLKTQPDAVRHFANTSNMDDQVLLTMAERAAVDLGVKLDANAVVVADATGPLPGY